MLAEEWRGGLTGGACKQCDLGCLRVPAAFVCPGGLSFTKQRVMAFPCSVLDNTIRRLELGRNTIPRKVENASGRSKIFDYATPFTRVPLYINSEVFPLLCNVFPTENIISVLNK